MTMSTILTMWGTLVFLLALWHSALCDGVMGKLGWCNTLCMCRDSTHVEVKCFERTDIYELLDFQKIQVFKLEKINWRLENQLQWCNNTCLCHQNDNQKVFKCVEEDTLKQFISDRIGDEYFYTDEELAQIARDEELGRRGKERKRGRKNRKFRKRIKNRQTTTTSTTTSTTPEPTTSPSTTQEVVELVTSPFPTEAAFVFDTTHEASQGLWHPPSPILVTTTSGLPAQTSRAPTPNAIHHAPPFESHQDLVATQVPEHEEEEEGAEAEPEPEAEPEAEPEPESEEEEEGEIQHYGDDDMDAELLPKQEAVAASPAVTAMQPPTRHHPFPPPTASSHAATREVETLAPKVSAVLEVPVQRKTVASEVSQDLDELGSAVMQIKSDVVLNQRILLVTVAVAGIAMLGVLILAVHSCVASRRQAAAAEQRRLKDSPKDDNHVTKVNLEEAW